MVDMTRATTRQVIRITAKLIRLLALVRKTWLAWLILPKIIKILITQLWERVWVILSDLILAKANPLGLPASSPPPSA